MAKTFIYKATALLILQSIAAIGTLHAASFGEDDNRGLSKRRPTFTAPSNDLSAACQSATLSSRFNGCGEVRNRNTTDATVNSSLQTLQAIPQAQAFIAPPTAPRPVSPMPAPIAPVAATASSSNHSTNVILDTLPQVDPNAAPLTGANPSTFQTEITGVFNGVDNRNVNGRNTYGDPYGTGAQNGSTPTDYAQTPYSNIILDTLPQMTSNTGPLVGVDPNTFQAEITAVFHGVDDRNIGGPTYQYTQGANGQTISLSCASGDPRAGVVDGSAHYIGPFDYADAREAFRSQCGATAARPAPLDAPSATGPNYTYNMETNGQAVTLSCGAGAPRSGDVSGTVHYIGPFDYGNAQAAFSSQCGAGATTAAAATPAPRDAPTGPNYTYNMGTNGQAVTLSCAAGDPRAGDVSGTVHYIGPFDYEAARNAFRSQCGAGAAAAPAPVARAVATLPPVPVSAPVPVVVAVPEPEPVYDPRSDWY